MSDEAGRQKIRERRFRETDIPFGEFIHRNKGVWYSLAAVSAAAGGLRLRRGMKVLDAGSSDGRMLAGLVERGLDPRDCFGLDMAQSPLAAMVGRYPQLQAVAGDVCALPFKEGCFDAVVSLEVVHHLLGRDTRLSALRAMFRVLDSGGRMAVSVLNRACWAHLVANGHEGRLKTANDLYVYLYDSVEWRADLEASGLIVDRVVEVNIIPAWLMARLGPAGVWLDRALSQIPGLFKGKGRTLLAVCRKN